MPSAVLTVKETPPVCAGAVRLTVKLKLVVPALPSSCDTLLMESEGVGVGVGEGVGVGVAATLPGASATPRKAVFVAAVAIVVTVPETVALYPVVSVKV